MREYKYTFKRYSKTFGRWVYRSFKTLPEAQEYSLKFEGKIFKIEEK